MITRPLGSNPSLTDLEYENYETAATHNEDTITIELSSTKRIVLSNGVATLYGSFGATDVSTSSSPEAKILALESLQDLLQAQGRGELDPTRESPIVNRIIDTFPSKLECIKTINRHVSIAEHRRILTSWAADVWGEDPQTKLDSDQESLAGSLFSDSDIQEVPDNRIRPITLRPRKSIQPTPAPIVVKIEGNRIHRRASFTTSAKKSQTSLSSYSPRRIHRGSLSGNTRERSPRPNDQTLVVPEISVRMSPPIIRHKYSKSEASGDRSEVGKKRSVSKPENVAFDTRPVKRVKSAPDGLTRAETTVEKSSLQTSKPEQVSLAKALNETINPNDHSSVSSTERVSKYWREITMKFPPEVKALPTIDRLAYYFREAELAKEENKILKRDESERRKSMVLLAEKIRLMNQPVENRIA